MVSIALQGLCPSSLIGCWSAEFRCFAARLEEVHRQAAYVFGNPQQATVWLQRPALGLDWRVPCRLLSNADGYLQVVNYLERVKYGVYC
ncbi:antitoxin Xre/MbcA/ParS toxin-binding domain-containing protein [Pseudomonas amygdali]|uniref:antitoxin Xre/MbcA/ParS toxin-binding domain-containing protein n=1 Tax=Pseudomonas amygdali TaxID=47877 RepID=UPI000EFDD90E